MIKRYDSYKDSGIEWIGQVPEHWANLRLRFACELRNGYTPSKDNSKFWENGTIPWYRMEDIRDSGRKLKDAKQYITKEAVKGGGLFEAGSFIMATTATIGEHAVLIVDSLANQRFTNLKIRKSLSNILFGDFFFYYLFVIDEFCKSTTRTATFPAVNMEDLRNFYILIPSIKEQKAIVTYLDKILSGIDKAIAQQQRMIDLLNERKQIIIQQAVTKGLNPNVKMKDSGVEWIGQVPEHWDIKCLKYTCKINGRVGYRGYTANDLVQEGEGAYTIGGKHITSCKLDLSDADFISWKKYYESPEIMVKKGDIVMAQRGSLGKAALIEEEISEATINPSLVLLNKISINAKFLHHYLISNATLTNIQLLNTATAVPMISQNQISNMKIPVPPLSEQQQIVDHIEQQIGCINKAIAKQQQTIDLLKERKQIIINEAVTGKIKVV